MGAGDHFMDYTRHPAYSQFRACACHLIDRVQTAYQSRPSMHPCAPHVTIYPCMRPPCRSGAAWARASTTWTTPAPPSTARASWTRCLRSCAPACLATRTAQTPRRPSRATASTRCAALPGAVVVCWGGAGCKLPGSVLCVCTPLRLCSPIPCPPPPRARPCPAHPLPAPPCPLPLPGPPPLLDAAGAGHGAASLQR